MRFSRVPLLLFIFVIALFRAHGQAIRENKFVSIGGIEQWVTITGDDRSKPVILFLHGGPGSTMSQYGNVMFRGWEKEFILVNWDQRGAGRTFGRIAPPELNEQYLRENPLTVDQMANDGIELTGYLLQNLGKEKVLLVGSSWGSVLGVEMALRSPDLFFGYVGHSQIVDQTRNAGYAYDKTYELAKNANDTSAVKILDSFGKPPYDNARTYGKMLRIVKKYERMNSTPAPEEWFSVSSEYDNQGDEQHRNDGDDYSFVNFFGDAKLGIKSMMSGIDFEKKGLSFKLPVFFIQGASDILTPAVMSKAYFEKIKAPKKKYYVVTDAAHGFNQSVVDTIYQVIKTEIRY